MQDRIKQMAEEAGFSLHSFNSIDGDEVMAGEYVITDDIARFAQLVAEDCAKVVCTASIAAADMYGDNAECLSTGEMAQDAILARYGIKE